MNTDSDLDRGLALQRQGRLHEAIAIYRQILSGDSRSTRAFRYLGLAYMQIGKLAEAAESLARSLECEPNCVDALSDLGAVLVRLGRPSEAVALLARALEIDANHVDALNNIGVALDSMKRTVDALPYFERLVRAQPHSAKAWAQLGETYLTLRETEKAIEHFREALKLDPDLTTQRILLGEALETVGRFKQAVFQYVSVLEKDPVNAIALARLLALPTEQLDSQWVARAEALLQSESIGLQGKIRLHIALGQCYDRDKEFDLAFDHFQSSHRLRARQSRFSSNGFSKAIDRLIEVFTSEFFASLPRATVHTSRPIFIVGMPRSGTTLTEQILASHSRVAAGGELPTIMNLASQIQTLTSSIHSYPDCMRDLGASARETLSLAYLKRLDEASASADRVTDKLPFNFMHLGLIATLFPMAKIVHCKRNPLDTCLSCYFVSFADELQFASDLETLGRYFRDYQRLMQHWQRVLPMSIHDLDYERLVQDTESTVRALLGHCELEWNEACLQFHETERGVRTPSRWQVRQPIYSQSIGRWRSYDRHLAPLKRILHSG